MEQLFNIVMSKNVMSYWGPDFFLLQFVVYKCSYISKKEDKKGVVCRSKVRSLSKQCFA